MSFRRLIIFMILVTAVCVAGYVLRQPQAPRGVQSVVQASKPGYFSSDWIQVNAMDPEAVIKLTLGESAAILGMVIDVEGQPVSGARIAMIGDGAEIRDAALTGNDGRFE